MTKLFLEVVTPDEALVSNASKLHVVECRYYTGDARMSTPVGTCSFVAGENCTPGRGDEPQDVGFSFRVRPRFLRLSVVSSAVDERSTLDSSEW